MENSEKSAEDTKDESNIGKVTWKDLVSTMISNITLNKVVHVVGMYMHYQTILDN